MSAENNAVSDDFAEYLQRMVKLGALETITQNLDKELAESQRVLREMRTLFDAVPNAFNSNSASSLIDTREEDMSRMLDAEVPQSVFPDIDMENISTDELDKIVASIKVYAEGLKNNLVDPLPTNREQHNIGTLQFNECAASLEQLGKRLSHIKFNKTDGGNRNPELETKLEQLCLDINMFTKMFHVKTTASNCNNSWTPITHENSPSYADVINKIVSSINEVTYLLQSKN